MVTAFPLPTEERILLRHCGGFLPPLFSPIIIGHATRHRDSSITHWNTYRGSAGLVAVLLRQRSGLKEEFAIVDGKLFRYDRISNRQ